MAKSPAFQFYPRDFALDTAAMTAAERGGYITLLCAAWIGVEGAPQCHLVIDDARLARLAGMTAGEWKKGRDSIVSKFSRVKVAGVEYLFSKRLSAELAKQREASERARAKAEKRWGADAAADAAAVPEQCPADALHSSSSTAVVDVEGDARATGYAEDAWSRFWSAFPLHMDEVGGKRAFAEVFDQLPPIDELCSTVTAQAEAMAAAGREWKLHAKNYCLGLRWRDPPVKPSRSPPRASRAGAEDRTYNLPPGRRPPGADQCTDSDF